MPTLCLDAVNVGTHHCCFLLRVQEITSSRPDHDMHGKAWQTPPNGPQQADAGGGATLIEIVAQLDAACAAGVSGDRRRQAIDAQLEADSHSSLERVFTARPRRQRLRPACD